MKIIFNSPTFKTALISVLVIFNISINFSQSDTPCASTPLTLGSTCSYITHDATGYTLSSTGSSPSCGHFGTVLVEEDTWYSFVAPASGSVNLESSPVAGSTYNYADMAIYSGPCTGLVEIDCYGGYGGVTMPHFALTGLIPGDVYYARLYGVWDSNGGPKTIDFCAYAAAAPPSNDECINAIPVPVNSDEYCNTVTPGTITGATASVESTFCPYGVTANDDVWFSFVATNTLLYFHLLDIIGSTTDLSYSLHTGTCGSTNLGLCNEGLGGLFNNLTVGNTYYLRVFSTGSLGGSATFDLCITHPPVMPPCATNPAPGNTACTATPICNLDGYCGTTSGSYTVDSWPELGSAFCAQIDNNSFLSFTAEASTISFYVWTTNSTTGAGIQIFIFSADNCDSGPVTSHSCWNPGSANSIALPVSASGLTAGQEYYMMIDGQSGDIADYTIAAFEGIQTLPSISSLSGDTSICLGQSIDLMATGGSGNYVWSPSTTLSASNGDTVTSTPTGIGPITYSVVSSVANSLCPSTSTDFTLNVTSFVSGTDTQTACGSYMWIDGNTYTTSNTSATHTITGGSVSGCDSIVTLNLTVSNPTTGTDTKVTCNPFTWIDGVTYSTSNNTATYTIAGGSVSGCDSIVTLDLTISNSVTGTDVQTACDTYTWIDGNTYTASNSSATFTIAGGAVSGCDSIATLDLTISNSVTGTDVQTACDTYTWIDGNTYTANNSSATYMIVGGAASGCDSIVTLDLTISNSVTGTDTQVACGSYTWIDGITYTSSNSTATYTIIGGSVSGCDSIVTLNLTISNSVTGTDTQVACGSYTWIDGITYTSSNSTATYTITGGSVYGCDSTVTLDLIISNTVTGTDTQVICGSYTWIDGVTYTSNNSTAIYTIAGGSVYGCDSIVTLDLTISNSVSSTDTQESCGSYTWIDGTTYTSSNTTATYTIVGGSVSGCDSIVTLDLTIYPEVEINLGEDIGLCNETIVLSPGDSFQSYLWSTGSVSESISINSDGIYSVSVTNQNGCQGYDLIEVSKSCEGSIWVPNAFTPNGDLFNPTFFPVLSGVDETSFSFYIYNRWGELIFETNKIGEGWDGSHLSYPVQDGVYVWKIIVKFIGKTELHEKIGHVTLLR